MKTLIFLLLTSTLIFPQSAGKSGLSFLKLGFGARNIALADNGTVLSNDVSSLFYNPARLVNESSTEIILMHNEWIQDVRTEILGIRFSFFGLPIGIGVNSTSISDIPVRMRPGEPVSNFNAQYFYSSISTGIIITDELSVGFTGKYIYEDIYVDDSQGWGLDLGAEYKLAEDFGLSLAIRNIGKMNKLRNESSKLPTELRVGPAYQFRIDDYKLDLIFGLEFQKYFTNDDFHINSACEILYDNLIAFRIGYQTLYEVKGFTSGLGINWNNLRLDYAITPFSLQLGSGHSISLSYKF
jgi:hypothetical protein